MFGFGPAGSCWGTVLRRSHEAVVELGSHRGCAAAPGKGGAAAKVVEKERWGSGNEAVMAIAELELDEEGQVARGMGARTWPGIGIKGAIGRLGTV